MKLTAQIVSSFVGGQIEIFVAEHEFCGEIRDLIIEEDGYFYVSFAWFVKKEHGEWVKEYHHSEFETRAIDSKNIGPSTEGADDRIELECICLIRNIPVRIILNPLNGGRINPSVVKGFERIPS